MRNPNDAPVTASLTFMTSSGSKEGPQDHPPPPRSRHAFKVNDYMIDRDVSTKVVASGSAVC